jgi:hypothetical protein
MKYLKSISLHLVFICVLLPNGISQSSIERNKEFEIGIDFARINRDWIYYNSFLYPVNGNDYIVDLIPSVFVRFQHGNNALRIKIEYFQKDYAFTTHSYDFTMGIDGNLYDSKILFGYQRSLITTRSIKAYVFTDLGCSFYRYIGTQSSFNGWTLEGTSVPFNITGLGLFVQPGIGFKIKTINRLWINVESSLFLGKDITNDDEDQIIQDKKFIPRPLSLLGLSYSF